MPLIRCVDHQLVSAARSGNKLKSGCIIAKWYLSKQISLFLNLFVVEVLTNTPEDHPKVLKSAYWCITCRFFFKPNPRGVIKEPDHENVLLRKRRYSSSKPTGASLLVWRTFSRNPGHNSYEDTPEHRYQRKSSGIHLKKCHSSLAVVQCALPM